MKKHTFAFSFTTACLVIGSAFSTVVSAQSAPAQAKSGAKLYIVEQCQPFAKGARCTLTLEQYPEGAAAPAKAQSCAPGWVAHFNARQGTVESGGIVWGASVTCGYPSAEEALKAAVAECSQKTFVRCAEANEVVAKVAKWSPESIPATAVQTVAVDKLPGALTCTTSIPVKESADCPAQAAAYLRAAGLQ